MMHIHLVNYEAGTNDGILSKYAFRMEEKLKERGVKVTVSNKPNPKATWNHHINYLPYKPNKTKNSLMITHIWDGYKLEAVKEGMKTADAGICFSQETLEFLVKNGVDQKKLSVALPAHDNIPIRRKAIAILTNVYPDGCKREWMFPELLKNIDVNKFHFFIMGSGWEMTLSRSESPNISYAGSFDYDTHLKILNICDYCLYFGMDEGSMGTLDAKHSGLKIIAPESGFAKEMGVDYPFETMEELVEVFNKLGENPVEGWNWDKYIEDHLKIWGSTASSTKKKK